MAEINKILQLHDIYKKRGYRIRTGLQPCHFKSYSYGNLPFSSLFKGNLKLSVGGGIAFTEMFFFSELCLQLSLRNILIIGNSFGVSSVLLSLLNPNAKVVAIDAGVEGIDNNEGTTLTMKIARDNNLNLEVINGFSPNDVPKIVNKHINGDLDFVFIDGLHTNKQQTADFNACWTYGGEKCIYVFHDVINYKMTNSFNHICSQHPEMRGDILWKTPSGMGIMTSKDFPNNARNAIDLFTETSEMIKFTKREILIEKFVTLPLVRSIPKFLTPYIIRKLRQIIYQSKYNLQ